MLEVPAKLRDRVRPRRSLPDFVIPPTESSAKRELDRIGKAYAKRQHYGTSPKEQFEAGIALKKRDGLQAARSEAHALLSAPTLSAVRTASIDGLAVAEVASHRENRDAAFATVIAFARGVPDAVSALARSLTLSYASNGNYTKCCFVTLEDTTGPYWVFPEDASWFALRHAVCAAGDEEYARAKKVATSLRSDRKLSSRVHACIAYAFPDETWSRDDVRAALDQPDAEKLHFLLGACDDATIARRFIDDVPAHAFDYAMFLPEKDALAIFEAAIPPRLAKPKYGPLLKSPPREIAMAVALFRTKRAAEILAPYFGHPILGPIVAEYFKDNDALRDALTGHAKGTSKVAEAARRVMEQGHERSAGPLAKDDDVPRVLRDRPWRPRERGAPVEIALSIPDDADERVELADAKRELRFEKENTVRDMTPAELTQWRAKLTQEDAWVHCDFESTGHGMADPYLRVPKDDAVRAWNAGVGYVNGTCLELLATHGTKAIPGFVTREWMKELAYGEVDDEPIVDVLARIVSPRIAPIMARVVARRKNFRRPALSWLLRHPDVAALGLVPDAVGKPGEARDDAELVLSWMAQKGARAAILASARTYGEEVETAIGSLLARDPLAIDATVPKSPGFLRPADLPAVRLPSGARFTSDAMDALLEMLRTVPLDPPYPGVADVAHACDSASLATLTRELVEQWVLAGSPLRFDWMLFSAARFPSPDVVRRVGQLARDWARRDRKKCLRACVALAEMGHDDDLPLVHLGHVAATSRFDDVRQGAQELLGDVAAARGLTPAELADRTVPDLDLGEDGKLTLSFGPRSFVVALDEALRPCVVGEKTFPRAAKGDDATLVKAAKARFDALRADAKAVADRQIRRFEQAMVTRRSWSAADFMERIVRHRLLTHLARRIVWEAVPLAATPVTFRVTEDGTLADAADVPIELHDARVYAAHPSTMSAETRRAWATVFGDYRIVQPFEQLARVVPVPPKTASSRFTFPAVRVAAKKLLGTLESRGWRRDDRAHVTAYVRPLLRGGEARMALDPGIDMEDLQGASAQSVTEIALPAACKDIDPIDFTELSRDVEALR